MVHAMMQDLLMMSVEDKTGKSSVDTSYAAPGKIAIMEPNKIQGRLLSWKSWMLLSKN